MTAIVGVLNKSAVAIAADSAVTMGNTHKVMNTANKIFSLSKHAPVGIAIYGNAYLMDTPWEVIIKCYRRHIKTVKFMFLRDYVNDFVDFLRKHEFFASLSVQRNHLFLQMDSFYKICVKQARSRVIYSTNPTQAVIDELNDCKQANLANPNVFGDFQNYSYSDFVVFAKKEIEVIVRGSKELQMPQHFNVFAESFYYYMRTANLYRNEESGLVFVGYGEEEIYPFYIIL